MSALHAVIAPSHWHNDYSNNPSFTHVLSSPVFYKDSSFQKHDFRSLIIRQIFNLDVRPVYHRKALILYFNYVLTSSFATLRLLSTLCKFNWSSSFPCQVPTLTLKCLEQAVAYNNTTMECNIARQLQGVMNYECIVSLCQYMEPCFHHNFTICYTLYCAASLTLSDKDGIILLWIWTNQHK
jgi:hypothetical protein